MHVPAPSQAVTPGLCRHRSLAAYSAAARVWVQRERVCATDPGAIEA